MNLTCEELVELIYGFVEGELVAEHAESFEIHIAGCSKCGLYVESYRHTVRMTRSLPRCGPLPSAFAAKLQAMLEAQQRGDT